MARYTEADMQAALDEIQRGAGHRKTALRYAIPQSTISGRLHGKKSSRDAKVPFRKLSARQEEQLVEYILSQASMGFAATHVQIQMLGSQMLSTHKPGQVLGKSWVAGFLARNPDIKNIKSRYKEQIKKQAMAGPVMDHMSSDCTDDAGSKALIKGQSRSPGHFQWFFPDAGSH